MIVHQNRHSTNSVQQSLVENSETKNNQHQFISHRMQQNTNEHFLSQHNNEFYTQSSHQHPHFQYQYESHSLSPQQSSTSDVEETSSSSLTRTVTTKLIKKKKQTKKKRKDPNEPQKPVSPYALFFRDTQNDIKKKLPNPSFGEISKVVAHMWENIEPELKEQYKRNAASAKKEYLKQLAAYRAVQISHQTPTMHHILHQTSLPFNPHQQKHYHTGSMITNHHQPQRQFCPASSMQQYNNFHYVNPYTQDNSNAYHSDRSIHFPNHPQQTYSSYDSNNNYPDYQQYNLLRPVIESEHYSSYYSQSAIDHGQTKSNENLLHNSNNNTSPYTDLNSSINDKHYYPHHGLNDKKEDDHSSLIPISNENNFHWNQTTSSTTEW